MVEVRGSKSENFIFVRRKNDGTLWKKNISIGAKFIRPGAFYTTTLNSDLFKLDSQNEKQCHVRTGLGFDHPIKFRSD